MLVRGKLSTICIGEKLLDMISCVERVLRLSVLELSDTSRASSLLVVAIGLKLLGMLKYVSRVHCTYFDQSFILHCGNPPLPPCKHGQYILYALEF